MRVLLQFASPSSRRPSTAFLYAPALDYSCDTHSQCPLFSLHATPCANERSGYSSRNRGVRNEVHSDFLPEACRTSRERGHHVVLIGLDPPPYELAALELKRWGCAGLDGAGYYTELPRSSQSTKLDDTNIQTYKYTNTQILPAGRLLDDPDAMAALAQIFRDCNRLGTTEACYMHVSLNSHGAFVGVTWEKRNSVGLLGNCRSK